MRDGPSNLKKPVKNMDTGILFVGHIVFFDVPLLCRGECNGLLTVITVTVSQLYVCFYFVFGKLNLVMLMWTV